MKHSSFIVHHSAFVVLASLLSSATVAAQRAPADVSVEARLSSTRITAGESTVLEIVIETQGAGADAIDAPRLEPGLEVTSSQDFSQLQVGYPGGRKRLIRRDLVIRAHSPGDYVIPPLRIEVDGETYRTRPLSLFVEQRRSAPRRSVSRGGGEVMLRAWVEPDTVYVGQQVLLHAEALFPRDLRRRQSRPAAYEAPTPSDFWIQDLTEAVSTGIRSLNGVVFETQTFHRAYFPLSPGRFTLPPARLTYEVRRGFLYAPEGRELVSDSIPLVVLPVPATGQPASFNGAVGRFDVEASIQPREIDVGEAATLSVEVSGRGNVKALPPPKLPELAGLEVFPPTEDASIDADGDEVRGVKRFTWVLLPEDPGRLELPIEYAFFDPERRRFTIARSEPLSLTVSDNGIATADAGDAAASTLRPIALEPARGGMAWVPSRAFALLQVVPLLAVFAGLVLRRNSETIRSRRSLSRLRRASKETFAALQRSAVSAESDAAFFDECTTAIRTAIADRLERPELASASRDGLIAALRERGVSDETADTVEALFARIDRARFTRSSASAGERAAVVAEAERLIEQVEHELRPAPNAGVAPTPRGITGASLLVGLLWPFVAIAPAQPTAAQVPAVPFAEGVAAFHDARYTEAISAFRTHLQDQPRDANGWYNLGNAYVRDGRQGRAVWAWLRALEIAPRHAGARHNIVATGAVEALTAAPPRLSLAAREAALAFAVLWWLGGCTIAVLIATRARAAMRVILAAAGLAVVVAALAVPTALRRPTAVAVEAPNPLLAGPARRSERVASLSDGSTVTILERRGEWWRVRGPRGREGWVEAGSFAEI